MILFICSISLAQSSETQTVIDPIYHPSIPSLDDITGTWLAENGSKSKWIFGSNNTAKFYYNNEVIYSYSYRISDSSPQCGKEVKTGKNISFLELTDVSDGDQKCYYINGLNEETLSISPFGKLQ